jgi:hypothetical protein
MICWWFATMIVLVCSPETLRVHALAAVWIMGSWKNNPLHRDCANVVKKIYSVVCAR